MSPALMGLLALLAYAVCLVGLRMVRTSPASLRGFDGLNRSAQVSLVTKVRRSIGTRAAPMILRSMGDGQRRRLEHALDAAGRPDRKTLADVAAIKAGDMVIAGGIGLLAALSIHPLLLPAVLAYGYFREDLQLRDQAKKRQQRIERDLPDYLDILVVTVQAGLKFRGALRRVGEQFESPVADEFRIALQQLDVGASRRDAFEGIRQRNDSTSLNRFVGSLLQAEELGTPLTDSMTSIARDMRKSFSQRVRKQAAEAVPKVTLVATVVLMPAAALLLIVGLLIGGDFDFGAALGG